MRFEVAYGHAFKALPRARPDQPTTVSLDEMRGSMSLSRCPNPAAFERGNYVRILQSWHRMTAAN